LEQFLYLSSEDKNPYTPPNLEDHHSMTWNEGTMVGKWDDPPRKLTRLAPEK